MTIQIQSKSGAFDIEAAACESVLFAGLRHGLTLPYECATGTCGTCRARVTSGSVEVGWDAAPGYAKLKREKGDILMCQSRATGPCVVRVPSEVAVKPGPWPVQLSAKVTKVTPLTHDVIEFAVELDRPIGFDAGQFVVVSVPGVTGARAYSMVNHSRSTTRFTFVVKRKPDGGFSDWLFAGSPLGQTLAVFGPLGRATFKCTERQNLVIVAGGSGIAGMMSILAHATASEHFGHHLGHVYFGVRTLADGFYLKELAEHVTNARGALEVTLVLSHETPASATHPSHPEILLDSGFVHEAAARGLAGGVKNALAFVAGPPPMVDAAIAMLLRDAGVAAQSIRFDKFG
jgi:toluene monooxygenase electron transfer component